MISTILHRSAKISERVGYSALNFGFALIAIAAVWADHADAIANAYGGSAALKSDFTRTNKRTRKGALEDGIKSIVRYLKNNFFDGTRQVRPRLVFDADSRFSVTQDGFDLVTGTWVPRKNPSASAFLIADPRPLIIRSVSKYPSISKRTLIVIVV